VEGVQKTEIVISFLDSVTDQFPAHPVSIICLVEHCELSEHNHDVREFERQRLEDERHAEFSSLFAKRSADAAKNVADTALPL
jgi:hypothetical protein